MSRINLYFRKPPERDRWLPGDGCFIPIIRRLIRKKRVSGVEKVFVNLCKGFDLLKIDYTVNKPFKFIQPDEPVIVLGIGKYALAGYQQPNRIIAGIGLMTHPADWPDLCKDYPVSKYLQHAQWTKNIYLPYYGPDICDLWPAGIDSSRWAPRKGIGKKYDVLVYNKIMWEKLKTENDLKAPILQKLDFLGLSYKELVYGQYKEADYYDLLQQSRAMIFLCEHESQGFACCEALSMDVPVFAWDQGLWLDKCRFKWNDPVVPATSIPFFDKNCGMSFVDYSDFENKINLFWEMVTRHAFAPRNYILENLTLERSAQRMLSIVNEVYS
jgi:hypothetical protein